MLYNNDKPYCYYLRETFEKFTAVSIENEDAHAQDDIVKILLKYIPEGYTLESEVDSGIVNRIIYSNQDNNTIDYMQLINFGTIYDVDTEHNGYEKMNINSFEGIKYVKNGINTVVFADGTYMYDLSGQRSPL